MKTVQVVQKNNQNNRNFIKGKKSDFFYNTISQENVFKMANMYWILY